MIYLDNAATTPIDSEVREAMLPFLEKEFGNPSSKYYSLAINAKEAVEESRKKVASLINADPREIIFTSCASESNNMIIKGVADYKKYIEISGNHLITSEVEHKSVLNTCRFLAGYESNTLNVEKNRLRPGKRSVRIIDRGYHVSFLPVNEFGQVEPDVLRAAITKQTVLVSLIWGNNETGTLNDIEALGEICRERGVLFHSDATQVLGKIPINVKRLPVDFLSFSAHKIYGPKGVGACFMRCNEIGLRPSITAFIHGGSQEDGYRAGTYCVHNIVGFGKAAEIAKRDMTTYIPYILDLEHRFKSLIIDKCPNATFNGHQEMKIPGLISINIPGINNELFVKKLAESGIAASTGSACSVEDHNSMNSNYAVRFNLSKYSSYTNCIEVMRKIPV
ncbi:aminotransferase class V-fold PLP-dependent enzyme [Heliobacterium gestii]|uniref:cysteine desulfurase n=1 Tax=Heliomicrobium gestii TaxID=2699 RepID=A0A845LAH2_HELGE|nr:cysteine desulfurase family protein [Heliomicrobium gestii]MBM7865681.1 cysteine desulfurase [Heliomicrobium gestii]MZP41930.1 aminotransferase class V-fold PLP-dependent enzyme [Heliomicrobium gestii]